MGQGKVEVPSDGLMTVRLNLQDKRDRRFKIDPDEKNPGSPRYDWSRAPRISGGAFMERTTPRIQKMLDKRHLREIRRRN